MDDRRGDWQHGVDENLASLNASQRVWDSEQKLIRKLQITHDNLLRGDPEKDTDGLIARLHNLENDLNLLKAILLKDKAGNKGIVGRVESLETQEKTADTRQKVWIALIGLISAILVALVSNLDRIEAFLKHGKPDAVSEAIERGKHPKGKKIYKIRVVPAPEPEEEEEPHG